MVFLEDLNLVGPKAAMLDKHCLDAGFGQFFNIGVNLLQARCIFPESRCQKDERNLPQLP